MYGVCMNFPLKGHPHVTEINVFNTILVTFLFYFKSEYLQNVREVLV
jgi:hypothetical protein